MNTEIEEFVKTLPVISPLSLEDWNTQIIYLSAIGFEDRSLSVLNEAIESRCNFDKVIAIEYEPHNRNNRKSDYHDKLNQLCIPAEDRICLVYNRYDPESFVGSFRHVVKNLDRGMTLIVDISAMSKFLIVVLLQELREINERLEIVYAEAKTYHPTKKEYQIKKNELTSETPVFLTTDVYTIVTTNSLSSFIMQGYPLLIIAFPTFNNKEVVAILNEIMPQKLISLVGKPHRKSDLWRIGAVQYINKMIEDHISYEEKEVSTFDYIETIKCLEEIYIEYGDTHRIIIAPTGSKLQSIAVFLFKQMHPDVQIIYPVTKEFAEEYTKGYRALWRIRFDNFYKVIDNLNKYRKLDLRKLKNLIRSLSAKP